MTRKRAPKRHTKPRGQRLSMRYKFDDGDESVSLQAVYIDFLRETARMYTSGDARMFRRAEERFATVAEAMAAEAWTKLQLQLASQKGVAAHKKSRKVVKRRTRRSEGERMYSKRHERRLRTGK